MEIETTKKKSWQELRSGKVWIVADASSYKFESDSRSVIPFVSGLKWGAMNGTGEVIIEPKYDFVINDPLTNSGFIRVGIIHFSKTNYMPKDSAPHYKYVVGLFDSFGKQILDIQYAGLIISQDGRLITVRNLEGLYGVMNVEGSIIVPFGKYSYIDGFDKGLARVKIGNLTNGVVNSENKWGLINDKGEEVLPVEYDNIWKFYGKNRFSTRVEKGESSSMVYFQSFNPLLQESHSCSDNETNDYDNTRHYDEFVGSYAQDVMGYSDEDIYDAFDGDADAYWNID